MRTKEEYEILINSSEVFSIDNKKYQNTYADKYRKLQNYICEYFRYYIWKNDSKVDFENQPFTKYGLELMITCKSAVTGYNKERGEFLSFYNYLLKKNIEKKKAKDKLEEIRKGIKVGDKTQRKISAIMKMAKAKDLDLTDDIVIQNIADVLKMPVVEIKKYIKINEEAQSIFDTIKTSDDVRISIFDTIQDKFGDMAIENIIVDKSKQVEFLETIQKVFNQTQERQKSMLSMLITVRLLEISDEISEITNYSYLNQQMIKKYRQDLHIPTDKEIADAFGVSPQSVSRTFGQFKRKLQMEKDYE